MAESRWRLDRTHRFEAVAYDQLLDEYDETNPDHVIVKKLGFKTANIFDLLQRYAVIAERSYYKAHRELTQARKTEKRNKASEAQIWMQAQLESTKIPAIDDPIWLAPTPTVPVEPVDAG